MLEAGDEELARDPLERGANPNTTGGRHGLFCTMDYVRFGKVSFDMGRALVAAGFDLTKRRQGYAPLQRAIWHDKAIRAAIRAAEKRLAKPKVPPIATSEQRRVRRAIKRLHTALGNGE